jgi:hypothetical protein
MDLLMIQVLKKAMERSRRRRSEGRVKSRSQRRWKGRSRSRRSRRRKTRSARPAVMVRTLRSPWGLEEEASSVAGRKCDGQSREGDESCAVVSADLALQCSV